MAANSLSGMIEITRRKKRTFDELSPDGAPIQPKRGLAAVDAAPRNAVPNRSMMQRPVPGSAPRSKLIGTSRNPQFRIKANKSFVKKAFFYVGNVASTSEKDMGDFISDIGFRVISCFVIRKQNSSNVENNESDDETEESRNSKLPLDVGNFFRICIDAEDAAYFLNPARWPESFIIRKWTFKPKTEKRESQAASSEVDKPESDIAPPDADKSDETVTMETNIAVVNN